MSRSDRYGNVTPALITGALFALAFAGIFAAISWHQSGLRESYLQYQKTADQNRRHAADEIAAECEGMESIAAADCIADKVEAYYREQAINQDLHAQQNMAFWAQWMFYATVGTVFLTAIGISLIYLNLREARRVTSAAIEGTEAAHLTVVEAEKTTREAKRQADLQEEAFRRLERPYLFIEVIGPTPIRGGGRGSRPHIRYRVVNYGKTPALLRTFFRRFGFETNWNKLLMIAADATRYDIIAPGDGLPEQGLAIHGRKGTDTLTEEEAARLHLHAYFVYEDITGAVHSDYFRFGYQPSTHLFYLIEQRRDTAYPDQTDQQSG